MAELPTFSSGKFTWHKGKGTASLSDLGLFAFPADGFYIRSIKTGKRMLFVPDTETMVANEFFDGEASAYHIPGRDIEAHIWC